MATAEEIKEKLPPGWELLKVRKDGVILVESEKHNVVIWHESLDWILQRITSIILSAR